MMSIPARFIDIGANLTDPMFKGIYNNSAKHAPDLFTVLERSWSVGLQKIIVTGGSLSESKAAIELACSNENRLYATVGCHPTRCTEFEQGDPSTYLEMLKQLVLNNKKQVVAIGECGLDFDRLQFCSKDTQKKYFALQLQLCASLQMPLFLHCRNAASDLYEIVQKYKLHGVVHSFDGTIEDAMNFIDMGYYIGINGCSLKTENNLKTIAKLPNDRILLETDSPWCEIKQSHAGYKFIKKDNIYASTKKEKWTDMCMVKGRNEPANTRHILDIVSAVKEENAGLLCEIFYQNSMKLFFSYWYDWNGKGRTHFSSKLPHLQHSIKFGTLHWQHMAQKELSVTFDNIVNAVSYYVDENANFVQK